MQFSESLRKNSDFQKVYQRKISKANRYLIMYVRENQIDKNRLGISVSKKVGNSVVRHHLCRLVREAYRLHESCYQRGLDIVVVARVTAKDCTYHQIESAMKHLAGLHGIWEDKE